MNLPEIPSEQKIMEWLQNFRKQIVRYFNTIRLALRSPSTLVLNRINRQSETLETQMSPLQFTLLTLLFASILKNGAVSSLGVEKPFFGHFPYKARLYAFQQTLTALQSMLPKVFSIDIIHSSLIFFIILLVVVYWARSLTGTRGRYWTEVAAFTYLLPLVLFVNIGNYCITNILHRIIGESALLFTGVTSFIGISFTVIVHGFVLKVIDRIYFTDARKRRIVHIAGYVVIVPAILFVLQTGTYLTAVMYYSYQVLGPLQEGDQKLKTGDYEAARKLFDKSIEHDPVGFWSGGARIRLISVSAQRVLALSQELLSDSILQERLLRSLMQTYHPYRRVIELISSSRPISLSPKELVKLREDMIDYYVRDGDVPVTYSELDRAIRSIEPEVNFDNRPKEDIAKYSKTPLLRQRLYYQLYRSRVLQGEPSTTDTRKYLRFLAGLPIRIEMIFLQYRALNLRRDSETLVELDNQNRFGLFDRERLIKGNKEVRDMGLKFAHLNISDDQIEKMSDEKLGFLLRQTYVNYLRNEARLLAASHVRKESSLIGQQVTLIEEQLNFTEKEVLYRDIPPPDTIDQDLLKLLKRWGVAK